MQPHDAKPARGFTIGAALILFGIAIELMGFAVGWDFYGIDTGFAANSYVCAVGLIVGLVGLGLHVARV